MGKGIGGSPNGAALRSGHASGISLPWRLKRSCGGCPAPVSHDQTPSSDLLPGWRLKDRAARHLAPCPSCSGRLPRPTGGRLHRPPVIQAAPTTGRSPDSRGKPENPASDAPPSQDVRARRRRHVAAQWLALPGRKRRGAALLAYRCGGSRGLATKPRTPFPFDPFGNAEWAPVALSTTAVPRRKTRMGAALRRTVKQSKNQGGIAASRSDRSPERNTSDGRSNPTPGNTQARFLGRSSDSPSTSFGAFPCQSHSGFTEVVGPTAAGAVPECP